MADEQIGRGPLRRVPELVLTGDIDAAKDAYKRAQTVLKNRVPEVAKEFLEAMRDLGVAQPETEFAANGYVPLLDAHVLGKLIPITTSVKKGAVS